MSKIKAPITGINSKHLAYLTFVINFMKLCMTFLVTDFIQNSN